MKYLAGSSEIRFRQFADARGFPMIILIYSFNFFLDSFLLVLFGCWLRVLASFFHIRLLFLRALDCIDLGVHTSFSEVSPQIYFTYPFLDLLLIVRRRLCIKFISHIRVRFLELRLIKFYGVFTLVLNRLDWEEFTLS